MKTILVGVDFSAVSARLADAAFSLAAATAAKVIFLYVSNISLTEAGYSLSDFVMPRSDGITNDIVLTALKSYAAPAEKLGVTADCELIEGEPIETILERAAHHHADVIVLGHHRHGTFDRILDKNILNGVINRCAAPILLVPAQIETAEIPTSRFAYDHR